MKKNKSKLVILFMLLLAMLVSGCGAGINKGNDIKEKTDQENDSDQTNRSAAKYSWKDKHISLDRQYQAVTVTEDKIYGCSEENGQLVIICQDKESGSLEKQISVPEVSDVHSMDADEVGNIFIVAGIDENSSEFLKIDPDGNCSSMGNLVMEDTENAEFIQPKGLYVDGDGYFYVWYEMALPLTEIFEDVEKEDYDTYGMIDRIYVKDAEFQTVFYEQVANCRGSQLKSFFVKEEGNPLLIAEDPEGIYLQEMDVAAGKLSEAIYLDGKLELSGDAEIVAGLEKGFLFCQGSDLYEYDYDSGECEKLLNFASVGVSAADILYLGIEGYENGPENVTIEIVDCAGDERKADYTTLVQGKSEKTILELGIMDLEYAVTLEKVIAEYNRYSDDTRIEVVSYADEEAGYENGLEQLKMDIVRGEAPDIIDVSGIDYSLFINKGVFADLYDFLKQDTECSADMLMPSVLKAYENGGHLYSIAPAFQLYSMWGNNSVIQGHSGVTLAELMQMLNDYGKNINAISGFSADEPVLTTLCTFGMDEFIDWENAACNFTDDYFKELLTFAKEYKTNGTGESLPEAIKNENIVMSVGLVTSVADYQIQSVLYEGNLAYVGYPTANGSGTAVSYRGNELAVNAKKENQEAAWDFVKYYLLNGYAEGGFPVVKTQFDEVMEQAMQPTMVTSIEGTYEMSKGSYYTEDTSIEVFEATPEEAAAVKKLIDSADNKFEYHVEIMDIISEEAEAFLAGQKSAEDVAEIIQNRVSLYLQEQAN